MQSAIFNTYKVRLASPSGRQYFSPEQIIRMESSSNYTNIFFTDRKPILTATILKKYEKALLPYGFLRVHHSHLVNRKFIDHISDNLGVAAIIMQDATKVKISKRKKKGVFTILRNGE